MKTAVSIPDELFREIENYAKEHHYSRSEVFSAALREFFERREAVRLLDALNEAAALALTSEEKTARLMSKRHYSRRVLKEKY